MADERNNYRPGDTPVLAEEGGYAVVEILSRSDEPDRVGFKIRFKEILRQYPYVPYSPGDEIEISFNPKYDYPGGWRFESLESYRAWSAPEWRGADPTAGPSGSRRVTIFGRVDGVLTEQPEITVDTEYCEIVEEMSVEEARRRYPGSL